MLGSSITRTVDVRVVSATNRDLGEMVARGQFREDLLYRLNLIARPPARRCASAPGDVPLLAHRFLSTLRPGLRAGVPRGLPGRDCAGSRRSPGPATCASSGSWSSGPCS